MVCKIDFCFSALALLLGCETMTLPVQERQTETVPGFSDELPFNLSACGQTKGCYRYPKGCTDETCEHIFTQTVTGGNVTVELKAKARAWVAIGFNPRDHMDGAEVIGCQLTPEGSQINFKHTYNADKNNHLLSDSHPTIELFNTMSSYTNGYLRCRASRSLSTSESKTYYFGKEDFYYYLFALNDKSDGTASATDSLKHKHTDVFRLPGDKHSIFDKMNYNGDRINTAYSAEAIFVN